MAKIPHSQCMGPRFDSWSGNERASQVVLELACHCRKHNRCRFNPWVKKIPWRRHGNPLQYSCLENPMDKGDWWAIAHRATKSQS